MTRDDILRLTQKYGENWGQPHAERVFRLGSQIAGDLAYNPVWFWYAAFLHDWGAFPRFRQAGVEHALRSRQVIETDVLPFLDLPGAGITVILEAVEFHDLRDPRPVSSAEALLLREADFLDFLGPLGLARELAWGPNNLPLLLDRIRGRMAAVRGRFQLPIAQALCSQRIARMEEILAEIETDSLGYL